MLPLIVVVEKGGKVIGLVVLIKYLLSGCACTSHLEWVAQHTAFHDLDMFPGLFWLMKSTTISVMWCLLQQAPSDNQWKARLIVALLLQKFGIPKGRLIWLQYSLHTLYWPPSPINFYQMIQGIDLKSLSLAGGLTNMGYLFQCLTKQSLDAHL